MNEYSGIILKSKGKILLCKRSPDASRPNEWSVPSGKIEDNETPIQAAYREFYEETDIDLDKEIFFLDKIKNISRRGYLDSVVYIYWVEYDKPIIPDLKKAKDGFEHTQCGYFLPKKLPSPISDELTHLIFKALSIKK